MTAGSKLSSCRKPHVLPSTAFSAATEVLHLYLWIFWHQYLRRPVAILQFGRFRAGLRVAALRGKERVQIRFPDAC